MEAGSGSRTFAFDSSEGNFPNMQSSPVVLTCIQILLVSAPSAAFHVQHASATRRPGSPALLMHGRRVAVVTGANKGIGKEIARKLGAVPDLETILACRSAALGKAAEADLRAFGCKVEFRPLDLTDEQSMLDLRRFLEETYGKLDILVNNAAICFNDPTLYGKVPHTPFTEQADITLRTNFFGTLALTNALLPLLRASSSPRIVNVASAAGRLSILRTREKREFFTSGDLEVAALEQAMKDFVSDVKQGVHGDHGWPNTCYGTSKLGLIALTRVLARDEPGISINSIDPGFCATDQNANQGVRSPEAGALTAVALATNDDAHWLRCMPRVEVQALCLVLDCGQTASPRVLQVRVLGFSHSLMLSVCTAASTFMTAKRSAGSCSDKREPCRCIEEGN